MDVRPSGMLRLGASRIAARDQLPADVRRKATELVARMLRERWHRGAAAEAAGGRDNE